MSLAIQPLPEDPDALRRFAADLQAELARKDLKITAPDAEIHAKTLHIEKLKMQLAVNVLHGSASTFSDTWSIPERVRGPDKRQFGSM